MSEVTAINPRVKDLTDEQISKLSIIRLGKLLSAELAALDQCESMEEVKDWSFQVERIPTSASVDYSSLCGMRRAAWAKYMKYVTIDSEIAEKLAVLKDQAKKSGFNPDLVYVLNRRHLLDWETAYMVIRYGESVEKWPSNFSKKDLDRLNDWVSGKNVPRMVNNAEVV